MYLRCTFYQIIIRLILIFRLLLNDEVIIPLNS